MQGHGEAVLVPANVGDAYGVVGLLRAYGSLGLVGLVEWRFPGGVRRAAALRGACFSGNGVGATGDGHGIGLGRVRILFGAFWDSSGVLLGVPKRESGRRRAR